MKYPLKKIVLSSGEEIELESAQERDSQSLWQFGYTMVQDHEFQGKFPDEFSLKPEDEPKFVKDNEEHPCKLALVARRKNGEIIAMCNFSPVSRYRKMQHIVSIAIGIVPEYRDQKLGQILMNETLLAVKSNSSIEKVTLKVLATNLRAISLYKKLGFQEVGRLKNEFKFAPDDYRDDVLMELFV